MRKKSVHLFALVIIYLLLLLSVFEGCHWGYDIVVSDGIKTITVTRAISHFSFEYPSTYKISHLDLNSDCTNIWLKAPLNEPEVFPAYIEIFIQKNTSYLSELEENIEFYNGYDGFTLLDSSPITVAGYNGEQILFTYYAPPLDYQARRGMKPYPVDIRDIFFNQGSVTWKIELAYNVTTSEINQRHVNDFEQLIESLVILNDVQIR